MATTTMTASSSDKTACLSTHSKRAAPTTLCSLAAARMTLGMTNKHHATSFSLSDENSQKRHSATQFACERPPPPSTRRIFATKPDITRKQFVRCVSHATNTKKNSIFVVRPPQAEGPLLMQLSTAGKALVVLEHVRYIIGILIPGYFTARAAVSHESRIESCSRWLKYWSVCAALTAIETSVLGQLGWWAFISS